MKANKVVGMIRRSFKYMDKDIFVQRFTSRVRPILEYGNVIWTPSSAQASVVGRFSRGPKIHSSYQQTFPSDMEFEITNDHNWYNKQPTTH